MSIFSILRSRPAFRLLYAAHALFKDADLASDLFAHVRRQAEAASGPEKLYLHLELAYLHWWSGEKEEALRWLEKAFEERPNWIPWLKVDPALDPLRSDPRFGALLRRMGLPL